jgi:hypothetical protein
VPKLRHRLARWFRQGLLGTAIVAVVTAGELARALREVPYKTGQKLVKARLKLREWVRRYLPAEICGIAGLIAGATIARTFTHNPIVTSYAGTWGEEICFYGYNILREVRHNRRSKKRSNWRVAWITVRNLVIEFGPAGVADSLVVRPGLMFLAQAGMNNFFWGVLVGKVLADTIFYGSATIMYELRKKWLEE